MSRNASVPRSPLVSDDRAKETMQRLLHVAVHVDRRFTVDQIAEAAGLTTSAVSSYLSSRPEAQRQASFGAAMSIALVLGERAVNQMLALIGYGGAAPLDELQEDCPLGSAVVAAQGVASFLAMAADGRIDHNEAPGARAAVDMVIAELTPWSSSARAV